MRANSFLAFALVVCAIPAFGQNPSVTSPASGATVGIPFVLDASAPTCSGQTTSAMGYSIDFGATTFVYATSINAQVSAATGSHTVHVKSWGTGGAGCDTDVPIVVSASAAPAQFTDVTVGQPSSGSEVVSGFNVFAWGTQCDSQPIVAFGYSLDSSSSTTIVMGTWVSAPVTVTTTGAHTLQVKAWGNQGSACLTSVPINVMASPLAYVGSDASTFSAIQTLGNWIYEFDTGTSGSTYGASVLTGSPSLSGNAREFYTTSTYYGGERYYVNFGAVTSTSNFLYDTWVYLTSSIANVANLEFDTNQVMPNGQTVIFGFQCDGWHGTWDYTYNAGTPAAFVDEWQTSSQPCNIQNWTQNAWHHVQVLYSRDDNGNVTYKSVWLDNVEQDLYVTVPSAFDLGWGPSLISNFQVDGLTSATSTSTVYMDNLTEYTW
jgi:hypothetical protein